MKRSIRNELTRQLQYGYRSGTLAVDDFLKHSISADVLAARTILQECRNRTLYRFLAYNFDKPMNRSDGHLRSPSQNYSRKIL